MTRNYTKSKFLAGVALGVSLTASTAFADLRQAQAALASKDFASAINLAQTYYKQSPYDAALIMARSLIEVGQPALAERYARFAVDMVPNSFAARILTATALRQQGKNFESEIQFRRALDVADTDAERQMARQSMRIVENTKKWSGNLTLGIAPTTNVGKVSSAQRLDTVFDDFL